MGPESATCGAITCTQLYSDLDDKANKSDTADTGWKNVTLTSDFTVYTNSTARYRKIGKLVEIRGAITPIQEIAANNNTIAFTMPAGYRPSSQVTQICQGSDMSRWALSVMINGSVTVSRYGTTEKINISPSAWLIYHIMYFTD